ncbi:hypothetical protein LQ757_18255 [Agromyces sp. SYSU K20354]|uniref:hypothetical protein n=1 Tax=Agromyces cavernae TaxID=2898659 RepID=UPI001E4DC214|nr:hypothetical protein [Agromyces cavernae]MCD2444229.1 hypothetical protein [Agromyces cavernae]
MTPPDRARRWALLILAIYSALVAVVGIMPRPIDRGFTPWIRGQMAYLHGHGLRGWINYEVVEYAAHALAFVPIGILAVVVAGRRLAWLATLVVIGVGVLAEYGPSMLEFGSSPLTLDALLNAVGAAAGAAIGYWAMPGRRET